VTAEDEAERSPRLPHPDSLCVRCAAVRLVPGRATVFVLCTALPQKYPPQPVRACAAFRASDVAREER
jgi:hypothetical protein